METEDTKITINNNNKKKVLDFYPTPWILKKKPNKSNGNNYYEKYNLWRNKKKTLEY